MEKILDDIKNIINLSTDFKSKIEDSNGSIFPMAHYYVDCNLFDKIRKYLDIDEDLINYGVVGERYFVFEHGEIKIIIAEANIETQ